MSRKLDLAMFRGDDSDDDDLRPLAKRPELDSAKAKIFSYGVTKKTKRDLEKEQEERKRREEEEATKLALQEFSREFDNPHAGTSAGHGERRRMGGRDRTFVRAGHGAAELEAYAPQPRREERMDNPVLYRSPSPPPPPKPRGKRAMDTFLQEMKANQEAREARSGRPGYEGTVSDSGPRFQETTNLCIVNLPGNVTEDSVGKLFAKVGPVGTVKIMWPRGDEHGFSRRGRDSLTGFVCFMDRGDAENAVRRFDGYFLGDNALRVSWGKPSPVPPRALYRSTSPFGSNSTGDGPHRPSTSTPVLTSVEMETRRKFWLDQVSPETVQSLEPVLDQIRKDGSNYLNALKKAEKTQPRFAFLDDESAPEYHLLQYTVDPNYVFPAPPLPAFTDEGDAGCYSSDQAELSEQERTPKVELSPLAQRRFESMLRSMTGKRVEIARAMEFALKRAEAHETVIDIVCQSLCLPDTPIPKKLSRLSLISDILHNSASSLPNVWRYRLGFEKRLPEVFEHFAEVHANLFEHTGTIAANIFIQQADAILTVWERWFVFNGDVLDTFRKLLHRECTLSSLKEDAERASKAAERPDNKPVVTKSAGFKSSFKPISLSSGPPTAVDPVPVENGQVDDDVDGEAMDLEEDVDGEAMEEDEEDVDGEAM